MNWLVVKVVGVFAGFVFAVAGAFIAAPAAGAVDVDDPDRGWVYGKSYKQWSDGCGMPGLNMKLQVKERGKWVTIAKGKEINKKRSSCKKKDYGKFNYKTRYKFTLDVLGEPVPGERYTELQVREVWTAYGKPQKNAFVKTVYKSEEDLAKDIADVFNCVISGTC